jgi:parallel beta-helix repeat protein
MRKASLIVGYLTISVAFFSVISMVPENSRAATLFVGGTGPGNYTTIQAAVDNTSPGDTVYVFSGTYSERVGIYAPLSLVGENRDTTIIGGNYGWSGVHIQTDWVNVTGFTLTKNADWVPAINMMYADNCSISDNNISQFSDGIALYDSHNNSITNNQLFSNNESGITLQSSNSNFVSNNSISWSRYGGIGIYWSSLNIFINNTLVENGFHIYSSFVDQWNSHEIDSTNSVNGKPVQYWKNATSGTVPSGAGQVILGNCTGVVVENQNIGNATLGIMIGVSSGNYIANNTVLSNVLWGIHYVHSDGNVAVNNTLTANGDGFHLDDSDNETFIDNNVTFSNWDAFYIVNSHDTTFSGNIVSYNNYSGFSIWESTRGRFYSNSIVENGIVLVGSSLEFWNTHVIDTSNTVNGKPVQYWKNVSGGAVPSGAGQVILANCTGTIVESQNVSNGDRGIVAAYSSDLWIADNIVDWNTGIGIYIYKTDHSHVTGNSASHTSGYGITLSESDDNTLVGNGVGYNSYGLYLTGSNRNDILNNSFSRNTRDGVRFGGSNSNNTLDGNSVSRNVENGIHFYSTGNSINAVSNNTVRNNKMNGLLLNHSKNNLIIDNIFLYNQEQGILIWDSDDNVIVRNGFDDNEGSISLHMSDENLLYHNRLAYAIDEGLNFWNSSYPVGGNFWAPYNGNDVYSGPNQDQSGSDGIGDVPYDVPGGSNRDLYPLMEFDIPSPPSEPRYLEAVPRNGEVLLTWNIPLRDGGRPILNYTIYRGTAAGSETKLIEVGNVLTFTDTGLTNGQTYYYQVSATNVFGEGPRSEEANATPFNVIPICTIISPENGSVVSGTIWLDGNASDSDGTVEKVEMRIDDGPWVEVYGTDLWTQLWASSNVSDGNHTLYFRSFDGEDYSIVVNITVRVDNYEPPPPAEPKDVIWIALLAVTIAVVALMLIVYFLYRRRKKGPELDETLDVEEPPPE